jgi:hypothetical protein
MSPESGLITPEMQAAMGSPLLSQVSPPIAASDVRRWAIACYYPLPPPPEFLDGPDQKVPEEFNPFAWHPAAPAYRDPSTNALGLLEAGIGLGPARTSHGVHGGARITYFARMEIAQVIQRDWTLREYIEKQGKNGPLLLTIIDEAWTVQGGTTTKRAELTLIRY